MRKRTRASRGIQQLTGPGPGQRHQFLDVLHWQRGMHGDQARLRGKQADKSEILQRVIQQLLHQIRVGDVACGMNQQRVTVSGCASNDFRADDAGAARAVIDDELLAGVFGNFLEHDEAHHIEQPARGPCAHHAHGFARIGLRLGYGGCAGDCNGYDKEPVHVGSLPDKYEFQKLTFPLRTPPCPARLPCPAKASIASATSLLHGDSHSEGLVAPDIAITCCTSLTLS